MKSKLIQLRDYLLASIPAFDNGFEYAVKDASSGLIFAQTDKGFKPIFPEDRIGNYFFFLVDDKISFSNKLKVGNGVPSGSIDTNPIQIVAVVKDVDEIALMNMLRNAIAFAPMQIDLNSANVNTENIIWELIKGIGEDEVKRALARVKDQTIIYLSGKFVSEFYPQKCKEFDLCRKCE